MSESTSSTSETKIPVCASSLEPMVREAGKIAMHYFGAVTPERKADSSPVSAADREVERFLVREITNRFPDHCIVGEEYGEANKNESPFVWTIDPIDGTAGFLSELPTWTVCLGLQVDGEPEVGLVYAPVADDLYSADPTAGAKLNGRPIHVDPRTTIEPGSTLLTYSLMHRHLDTSWPERIWALSSAAVTLVYVARGSITAGLVDPVHCYDIAAAAAILKQAGGEVRYLDSGAPVDFYALLSQDRADDWIVAANPQLVDLVRTHFTKR